jgi:probable HAF family extracellular repeat protein
MRTENRSRTPILPSAIVIGVLAITASCGGDNAGIVAAPPQMKALLLSCHQESNPRYALTLLDSLGGPRSTANAINNLGQVAGAARTADGFADHAVVWNGAAITDLGAAGVGSSAALDINEAGQVVGIQGTASGWSAVSWFHGSATYLENLPGGVSSASGINDAGQIVGESEATVNSLSHASVWKDGKLSTMATVGGSGSGIALKINNAGDIVGYSANAKGEQRPTLWKNGSPVDLGTLGGPDGVARAINQQGQIVGASSVPYGTGFTTHATLWYGGAVTDLGTLGGSHSRAHAINASGQIVGVSSTPDGRLHPVVWRSATTSPVDIATLVDASAAGLQIEEPADINDRGQIVATALLQDGSARAVVLTPAGCQ